MTGTSAIDSANSDEMDLIIASAAKAADYEGGFGLSGCDLAEDGWWAAYTRQSTEEQRNNNRLAEYLLTCAKEAKALGVVVPREYILYDAVTGEHLEHPNMVYLRQDLIANRKIAGAIFPALDRLSREPVHIGVIEFEMDYCRVRYHYADAPNGSDPMSQMVRQNLAHAAKFVKLANRKNNRGGNIGRVLKGMVPALRPPHGYTYHAEYREEAGRRSVVNAWWEIDALDPDGELLHPSPAWAVRQIFTWVGEEGRTLYWVTQQLNGMGIKTADGVDWNPAKLQRLVRRQCYTGRHACNVHSRVPDPDRPITDITAEIRRTRLQTKPEHEWVRYEVPALVSEGVWNSANDALTRRGRGKGKEAKSIQALLRGRLHCPLCGNAMLVRRAGRHSRVYYHCRSYFKPWVKERCSYRRFIPGAWDELVWNDVCALLRDDSWIDSQLASQPAQEENVVKLLRLETFKLAQAKGKIAKIHEGFEAGIYTLDRAKSRINELQVVVENAQSEVDRLQELVGTQERMTDRPEVIRRELEALRDSNLDEASFEQRFDMIARLAIEVYPTEDLKSMRVTCRLGLTGQTKPAARGRPRAEEGADSNSPTWCGKVMSAPPNRTESRTPGPPEGSVSGGRWMRSSRPPAGSIQARPHVPSILTLQARADILAPCSEPA